MRAARFCFALAAAAVVSCSLVVDADSLNEGCEDGTKFCNGECVPIDPEVGCGRNGCQPCFLAGAATRCSGTGECVIGACNGEYDNCDGLSHNGCEVDLNADTKNCGQCENECVVPNAVPDCAQGVCAVLRCNQGFYNCDGVGPNGCESQLTDNANCGECDNACTGGQSCVGGTCQ